MTGSGIIVLVFLLAILLPIGLYYLVRAEHRGREQMDRRDAVYAARRDTRDSDRP